MHVPAAGQQPKFLAARNAQLILDVYLAGHLDTPTELLDKPFSFLRLQCLLHHFGSKANADLMSRRASVADSLIAGIMPLLEPGSRKRLMQERVELASIIWKRSRGDVTASSEPSEAASDLSTIWKLLVDKGLLSGQI